MMRGRSDEAQKKRLWTSVGIGAVLAVLLYVYFGSKSSSETALEYGSRSLRKLGSSYLGGDDDSDHSNSRQDERFGLEDGDDGIIPKSYPVCDDRHSELIPCLDRHLMYQMRLKLDLSLMEHYERHCPLPERLFNCLIPPPPAYKVPFKWPKSRHEVWKVNIPHTDLAHEKSDQNWMVVKGENIVFPGGGTHFHYVADKYIASIANAAEFLLREETDCFPWGDLYVCVQTIVRDFSLAASKVPRDRIQRLFVQQKQGIVIKASEEQIRAISQHAEQTTKQQTRGESRGPFSLLNERGFSSRFGQFFEASPQKYEQLRDLGVALAAMNINQGGMVMPYYNTRSTRLVLVAEGNGRFEMACPHLGGGQSQWQGKGSRDENRNKNRSKNNKEMSITRKFKVPYQLVTFWLSLQDILLPL